MRIAVSACLLGRACKYNGGDNLCERLVELLSGHEAIAVCPEVAGGLPTPRIPCERIGDRIVSKDGVDLTSEFSVGASREAAAIEDWGGCDMAILQPRSPSCGVGRIYDGSFTGRLTEGDGVFAALLRERSVPVYTVDEGIGLLRREPGVDAEYDPARHQLADGVPLQDIRHSGCAYQGS